MICENQKKKKAGIVTSSLIIALLWLCSCGRQPVTQEAADLPQIRERESLTVATGYNSADYFVYKGEPMGFQYEMLAELGRYLGVKIEIIVGKSCAENLQFLLQGRCDMVVSGLPPSGDGWAVATIDTLYMSRQVLVQRKPAKWRKMTAEEMNRGMVRNPDELNGRMVYASGWSSLTDGEDFVGGRHIRFVKLNDISSEGLVGLVSEGELDYAVCNRSEARLIAGSYDNIDMQTELGGLPVNWLVHSGAAELRQTVGQWLAKFKGTAKFAILYQKYHNGQTIRLNAQNRLFANRTGIISDYDHLFRKYSGEIGWDWRLLASLVCQESRFVPTVRSKKGAYGLMQLMPATLERFGADSASSPERHIAAGVAYIKYLDKMIAPSVSDRDERIKFILASYNIGPGHILDAQRLAEKYGKDATVWDNSVGRYLLSKSDPRFYTDPEVRHGKCRGRETYAFVSQVLERYGHYKNINRIQ